MRNFLFIFLFIFSGFGYPQKYVLMDQKMSLPVSYTNTVTAEHSYRNLFAVESNKIHQFISEVEKISAELNNHKKPLPDHFTFTVGQTTFTGLKIPLAAEERMDVVVMTNCDGLKISMHLSDPKISNVNNAFFINTWVKYIKSYVK